LKTSFKKNIGLCGMVLACNLFWSAGADAQTATFSQALEAAYIYNPQLESARAELRAVDETYAQAVSGYRPRVSGNAGYESSYQDGEVRNSHADPKTLSIDLLQPIYRGGTTGAQVKASENRIKAQRALLMSVEQNVFLQTVTAYMDVLRDQEIVRLTESNQKVLTNHLDESRQRFELGDLTKTDVSQAESRLAAAQASRIRAQGNEETSRAAFERATGLKPEALQKPQLSLPAPPSLDGAIAQAQTANPDMIYADYTNRAAKENTRAILGELRPRVDLTGSAGSTFDPGQRTDDWVNGVSIGVSATMPFYTSGSVDSRVRQSKQFEQQSRSDISTAERAVRERVIDAWSDLQASNAEMSARLVQIQAAQVALDGVKVEADYGSRTTLDLLDAEQEYLDAQVSYISAERDKIVALYTLLAATGDLTADKLSLNVALYSPVEHFQKIKNKWIGTGVK
jgi:outer membrane protein